MHFSRRNVALIGECAGRNERGVVLAPHGQKRRLMAFVFVIADQIKLDFFRAGASHTCMANIERFEYLFLGGGKGGKTLAMELAREGKRVALIERGMIGGSCINVACIPTRSRTRALPICSERMATTRAFAPIWRA